MAVGSFSSGLSGLNAHAAYLNVIGNNLANLNTVGFKASTVNFSDLVSHTVGGTSYNPMQVGLGVATGSVSPVFSQGTPQNTQEPTNAAIQGNGLFVIRNGDSVVYTRDGSFSFNANGVLVTADGLPVQGWTQTDPTTGEIQTTGKTTDIAVPPGVLRAPSPTTQFATLTNLSATAAVGDTFTTGVQVYDSLGASHVVAITYTKTGAGTWSYDIAAAGEDVVGGTAGTPVSMGTGTLSFDAAGRLSAVNGGATADVTVASPAWANGAAANTMTWDIVLANNALAFTGFNAPSQTASKTQNGSPGGMVNNITILADGTIQATFGAGQTVAVAKLALANFNNPKGLMKLGANKYGESEAAGLPNIGEAGTGGRGTLIGSALEQSNVDIAQEFTQMILAQRGYQANAKTITVSDELLADTLAIKR
ncbi:MAG: flgE [Acidobacteria bacterium]|jgi:flagellar hook protein FlgE|nr:flgE [Acidobacteriota bacterium]